MELPEDVTLTRTLGRYFASEAATLAQPDQLIHEMKRLLLDYLGIALAGSRTDSGQIAAEFALLAGGAPQSLLIGRGTRVPSVHAAFANAVAQHSMELDDIDELALFHYAPPIMSATLAVAEQVGASGLETLQAALLGCEMMARLSRATNPDLRNRGFHTTPACGVFAATVSAGRLLGLDGDQLTNALGLAGAQASGLMEMYGTSMQKRFNPGPAARNGVVAAQMASLGFTGADTILDGIRGFGPAFAGRLDPEPLLDGLGQQVPVIVEYKPYSCARPIHNAIDCALAVREALSGRLGAIEDIEVRRHPDWAEYHDIAAPRSFHEAQVSLPYSVAVALIDGQALPDQYSDERVTTDAQVSALSRKVRITVDPSQARGVSCELVVRLTDGSVERSVVDHARGSVQNPLSDDELVLKARSLAAPIVGRDRFEDLVGLVFAADSLESLAPLTELVAGPRP